MARPILRFQRGSRRGSSAMTNYERLEVRGRGLGDQAGRIDFMVAVWLWMSGAVLTSAAGAWACANLPMISQVLFAEQGPIPMGWAVTLAPLGLVVVLGGAVTRLSPLAAAALFGAYALLATRRSTAWRR
ncbi:FtsH-binding integral membrane protein [Caulobacter sp. 1776]